MIDNTATTLYAGGILNTGFALNWSEERVHDALPASRTGGQPWALAQIKAGDSVCKANQALHGEAVNLIAKLRANAHYVPAIADPLAPVTFVHKIHVPCLRRLPVDRRADRRALRRSRPALHRHPSRVVHVRQRHPQRLARSRDLQPLVRLPRAVRRPAAPRCSRPRCALRRRCSTARAWAFPASASRRTRSSPRGAIRRRWPPSSGWPRSRSALTTAPAGPLPGQPYVDLHAVVCPLPDSRHPGPLVVPGLGRRRSRGVPRSAGAERFTWNPRARAEDRLQRPGRRQPGRDLDRARRPTHGRRLRPAAPRRT